MRHDEDVTEKHHEYMFYELKNKKQHYTFLTKKEGKTRLMIYEF
jgi:hypothetical protein